ncbi:MAG: Gldg family protein [Planctomycetota bacterium]
MNQVLSAVLNLLLMDGIFLCVLLAVFGVIAGTKQAAYAVMKRNFVGYFSNPTGYVFLCIFVFLTSAAAFWPFEFFNQNLATLDQLNYWYPLIMLVFIPAITMSIWAEERRAGTDELLLTLPADDFDIVIGKYMSAAAIFTASLLFSQLSTFVTLTILTEGYVDLGLIFTTYLGYWFVGVTMIAIGMVASFLTGNLTVGFILGALFNAPLAFASIAYTIVDGRVIAGIDVGELVRASGIAQPFDDFGRGVISTSSVIYFVLVTVVALYCCMVLIGRRHWTGGKDGNAMAYHYLLRIVALVVVTGAGVILFRSRDVVRQDLTEGQVSSLADATQELIANLESDRPIKIDAFVSADIPEMYAQTRYELVNLLKEFKSKAAANGRTIEVNLYEDIDLFSDEAELAAERFGIEPVTRLVREQGSYQEKRLILGAAFRAGLEKVVVPVFEYGIPVEYELVRSINTVARGKRKRVGIVRTDAQMMGGVSMAGMQMRRIEKHPIIDELSKQYEVEEVPLDAPVSTDIYDALVVVQPSSLAPEQFQRLLDAIKLGIPTAVFEDPLPYARQDIPGTGQPKMAGGGGMFGGGGGPQPKGDIRELWDVLDIKSPGKAGMQYYDANIVWQDFNPYPNLDMNVNPLWTFIDQNAPGVEEGRALSADSEITDGLRQVLALYCGAVEPVADSKLIHTPLLRTGARGGSLQFEKIVQLMQRGQDGKIGGLIEDFEPEQAIAMLIEGATAKKAKKSDESETSEDGESDDAPKNPDTSADPIRVAYVADTDIMLPVFLQIRADPNQAAEMRFQFQNVTFLLNTIDWLTGETDFIDVRKHEPIFASLRMIDSVKEEASREVRQQRKELQAKSDEVKREAEEARDKELQELREELTELQNKSSDGRIDRAILDAKRLELRMKEQNTQRIMDVKSAKAEREAERSIAKIQREADQKVTTIQNQVKAYAVGLPCIPPLIVGIVVFAARRLRERENISKARLK